MKKGDQGITIKKLCNKNKNDNEKREAKYVDPLQNQRIDSLSCIVIVANSKLKVVAVSNHECYYISAPVEFCIKVIVGECYTTLISC